MSSVATPATNPPQAQPLHGLLIEFEREEHLIEAARQVREAGYTKFDAHSPFPVHGIDGAAGIRATRLPWLVFWCGALGAILGVGLQYWTNAAHFEQLPLWLREMIPNYLQPYPFRISGKPFFSFPANIPIIFELTVLLAAFAAVFGMLLLNNLPWFYNALFSSQRFLRATNDRFFISILAKDPRFDAAGTLKFAEGLGGTVEQVHEVATQPPPIAFKWFAWIAISLLLIPPALVAYARYNRPEQPRLHPIQDMDNQPRYKSQQVHPLMADGRAMRPPVQGTVARGDWPTDPHFAQGGEIVRDPNDGQLRMQWYDDFPDGVVVSESSIRRGQQRFMIYCAPCHGYDGHGKGIVNQRALELQQGWITATDLHSQTVRDREDGHIFNTIRNGIRSMPGYRDQISPEDAWNIVSYVRALQRSTAATLEDVPPDQRSRLR